MGVDYDKNMTSSDASVIGFMIFLKKYFQIKVFVNIFSIQHQMFSLENSNKIFHVWSGEGDNAKSVTQLLLERM